MKNNLSNIELDVFFREKLNNIEINPPDYIWENVSNNIPEYTKPLWKNWWFYNSIIFLSLVSVTLFYINKHTHNKTEAKIAQPTIKELIQQRTINNKIETNNVQQEQKSKSTINVIKIEPITKITNKVQQTLYYLDASSIGRLIKIEILDSLNHICKLIENPNVNEYGFYEIDIKNLLPGKYNIILYKADGNKIKREENFK